VLDLTRILAGPVGGRALAAWGADVMLVNAPHLPNIGNIADTSRGKRSCWIDLQTAAGRASLEQLIDGAHIMMQAYRPGALEALGFGPREVASMRPGIVYGSLCAYGEAGPWAGKRGFDSLVQTATGFNCSEAEAAGSDKPRALPMQVLDYASGYLMAFGVLAALIRQRSEGGSWHVRVALARTGNWLWTLGRDTAGLATVAPSIDPYLESYESGFGRLLAVSQPARFAHRPPGGQRLSMPPGSSPPTW
jgi:crotonobetainyl-CoA:carnitine CoA-transferase CaiB-like acyl-CoA transferase